MAGLDGWGVGSKGAENILARVLRVQTTGRGGVKSVPQLPKAVFSRLQKETNGMAALCLKLEKRLAAGDAYGCQRTVTAILNNISEHLSLEYLANCQAFVLCGGEVLMQKVLLSSFTRSRRALPDDGLQGGLSNSESPALGAHSVTDQSAGVLWNLRNDCLAALQRLCFYLPLFSETLSLNEDLIIHLFHLMGNPLTFDTAVTLCEEILLVREETMRLEKVPKFEELVRGFSSRQLAFFCRVLAMVVFEPDWERQPAGPMMEKGSVWQEILARAEHEDSLTAADENHRVLLGIDVVLPRLVKLLQIKGLSYSRQPVTATRFRAALDNNDWQPLLGELYTFDYNDWSSFDEGVANDAQEDPEETLVAIAGNLGVLAEQDEEPSNLLAIVPGRMPHDDSMEEVDEGDDGEDPEDADGALTSDDGGGDEDETEYDDAFEEGEVEEEAGSWGGEEEDQEDEVEDGEGVEEEEEQEQVVEEGEADRAEERIGEMEPTGAAAGTPMTVEELEQLSRWSIWEERLAQLHPEQLPGACVTRAHTVVPLETRLQWEREAEEGARKDPPEPCAVPLVLRLREVRALEKLHDGRDPSAERSYYLQLLSSLNPGRRPLLAGELVTREAFAESTRARTSTAEELASAELYGARWLLAGRPMGPEDGPPDCATLQRWEEEAECEVAEARPEEGAVVVLAQLMERRGLAVHLADFEVVSPWPTLVPPLGSAGRFWPSTSTSRQAGAVPVSSSSASSAECDSPLAWGSPTARWLRAAVGGDGALGSPLATGARAGGSSSEPVASDSPGVVGSQRNLRGAGVSLVGASGGGAEDTDSPCKECRATPWPANQHMPCRR